MRHTVSEQDIDQVEDLIEAGMGLGWTLEDCVRCAVLSVFGDDAQFSEEMVRYKPRHVQAHAP